MEYKFPPICKYGILLVLIFMFLKHQHILPDDKILFNSIMIVLFVIAIDYIIIKNHTPFLGNNITKSEHFVSANKKGKITNDTDEIDLDILFDDDDDDDNDDNDDKAIKKPTKKKAEKKKSKSTRQENHREHNTEMDEFEQYENFAPLYM